MTSWRVYEGVYEKTNTEAVGVAFGACNVPERDYADIINVCKGRRKFNGCKIRTQFYNTGCCK